MLLEKTDGLTREQIIAAKTLKEKRKNNRKKGEAIDYKIYAEVGKIGGNKYYNEMETISVSSNHSVAIGREGKPYSWGFNNMNNRLGYINSKMEDGGRVEPTVMEIVD